MGQRFNAPGSNLATIARETGYPVVEIPGWQWRDHGPFSDDVGVVVCHHTAGADPNETRSNYPSLNVVKNGTSRLAGPLSNYGIGFDGTIYVISAGTCWHAGRGGWAGYNYNSQAVGIEAEDAGDGDWTAAQRDVYPRLCAVIMRFLGYGGGRVCGHKEWCVPDGRKIDPAGIRMDTFRGQVKWYLDHPGQITAGKGSAPAPSGGSTPEDWPLKPGQYYGPKDGPANSIGGWYGPNPQIRRIQQRFQELGHAPDYPAWADGVWEPPTTEACKEWERAAGQLVDGVITENDWYRLFGDDVSAEDVWDYGIESGHKNNPKWKAKNFITNIEADGDQTQVLVRDVLRLVAKNDGVTADEVADALAPKLTTSILPMLGEAVETVLARDNADEAEAQAKAVVNEMAKRLATAR